MKITKFRHSCLLVELPDRTALFDPGTFSTPLLRPQDWPRLDDIAITHQHADHLDLAFIKRLARHFPQVRITAPPDAVALLHEAGLAQATSQMPEGFTQFKSPHESGEPLFAAPAEIGYTFLGQLSHPGDSHRFSETAPILALPVIAPWGSTISAVRLALQLKPRCIIPIHDWLWRDEWRLATYDSLQHFFADHNIRFLKPVDGQPFHIDPDPAIL